MSTGAPTEALAAFEPFVQWILSATTTDLSSLPGQFLSGSVVDDGADYVHDADTPDTTPKGRQSFNEACDARLALAEAESEYETAWDQLSYARRNLEMLGEELVAYHDERNETFKYIALLERRIMKLLQDRDLAIGETYTTEKLIQDALFFKAKQLERQKLQAEEQRKVRVASALRKLLLHRSGDESGNSSSDSPTATLSLSYTEKDVQRLHKELADSKVAAATAKAEQEERRHAKRRAERRCVELKLALAQISAEEDDLRTSLYQLTRARRNSVGHLQQISLFSSAALPLETPPAPTAGNYIHHTNQKPMVFNDDSDEEQQNPGALMWLEGDSLAPPCQSDHDIVSKIVEFARVTPADVLFDLGCGDGRICIEAAKRYGARARGVEIEEFLIMRFRELIAANNLQQLVSVSHGDLLEEDLSEATVIVTYLLPDALDQLRPKFIKLLDQSSKDDHTKMCLFLFTEVAVNLARPDKEGN
ncbi:FAM173 family [Plasmopara halstedii]|uniref:FAM173 family n=1 Tax=Plasmopara halstedii TaxID=4781 RepID=A0A0P1B1V6_PLAHL|nr:FAM173 family [Plasmopara halstedii]CEG48192.1 FAM173 family [Plasmopara halstedii]|eukprot:XP_024584561.1 FAM173 family [Plasmopara halstedii]